MLTTYRMENHTGWGNSIGWSKYPTRIDGHLARKPKDGDYVTCAMESGRVGVFQVTSVEHCGDPADMFFADVKPIGYEDELDIPAEARRKTNE
ncbi:hypothetical protein LCGC14_1404960 [marine sediment metagenome]|uniref:Uncharacterized protein n=1 Tax=marine sediment metagenome TaxID=412755 RepID=A0A0F9JWA7_9ZZZZ